MNLFRSEEHIARWLGIDARRADRPASGGSGREPGATIPVAKLAELAFAWWDDRLAPDWEPHTREQNVAILERLGLVGEFWELA
jgi:hypothetical protein